MRVLSPSMVLNTQVKASSPTKQQEYCLSKSPTKTEALELSFNALSVDHRALNKENEYKKPLLDFEAAHAHMTEQGKRGLKSIYALKGMSYEEVERIQKPEVKRASTVSQICKY